MVGKKLVFDIVLFDENYNFLETRVKINDSFIDFYIICGIDVLNHNFSRIISDEKLKKIPISKRVNTLNQEEISDLQLQIVDFLKEKYKSFDDIIFISESNQIMNIGVLDEEDLNLNPFAFFCHKVLEYNFDYKRKYLEKGTTSTTFSSILGLKNFLNIFLENKSCSKYFSEKKEYGWNLVNFPDKQKKVYSTLTYMCPISKKEVVLYPNHDVLSFGKKVKYKNKKIAFFIDYIPNIKLKNYNKIFKVKTSNEFPEVLFENYLDEVVNVKIFVPNFNLYGDEKNFQKKYIKNEILRMMNQLGNDDDIIDIFFKDGEIMNFKYSEIKNPS